jgi:ethanolamine utilization protein EutJ
MPQDSKNDLVKADIENPEDFLAQVQKTFTDKQKPQNGEKLKVGLDLGTASIVLVVLDADNRPLGAAREFAQVVRDGLVVDYSKAIKITQNLRQSLEKDLGVSLTHCAIAVPPGTSQRDTATHKYVALGGGLETTNILDEPTAANLVLGVRNGAIVDIGGGTTGAAVLKDGKVVHSFDEPTGGTHATLVIAGHHGISFEEAEKIKTDPSRSRENASIIAPVLQKMAVIVRDGLKGFDIDEIHLVGGTSEALGIEKIFADQTKCKSIVSAVPWLVTPAGIALSCL